MGKIFNSVFENSVRLVILLDALGTPEDLDMVYAADFIVSYGRVFGLTHADLNGDNPYMFSEFAARRKFVKSALRELVLYGLVKPLNGDAGVQYQITELGSAFSRSLSSDYAQEYRSVAHKVAVHIEGETSSSVISEINLISAKYRREKAEK